MLLALVLSITMANHVFSIIDSGLYEKHLASWAGLEPAVTLQLEAKTAIVCAGICLANKDK